MMDDSAAPYLVISDDAEGKEYNSEGELVSPDEKYLSWVDVSDGLDELSTENLMSPCPLCLCPVSHSVELHSHHTLHYHPNDGYGCPLCSVSFESLADEQQHASEKHPNLQVLFPGKHLFL